MISFLHCPCGWSYKVRIPDRSTYGFVDMRSHDTAAACILNAGTVGLSIKGSVVRCQWGCGKRKLTDARQRFPPDPRTSCWFCLAAPELEEHLLVRILVYMLIAHRFTHTYTHTSSMSNMTNDLSYLYLKTL